MKSNIYFLPTLIGCLGLVAFVLVTPSTEEKKETIQFINPVISNPTYSGPLKMTYYEGFHLVELQFPKEATNVSGTVIFSRPFKDKKSVSLPILLNCENVMDIFIRELYIGKWVIEVDWKTPQGRYLNQFKIDIPIGIDEDILTVL